MSSTTPQGGDAVQAGERRTVRQRQFIQAAARLFSRRGYHSVGINEISAELGLSGPAIYRHYRSKEALLVAVLDDAVATHLEEVRRISAAEMQPMQQLVAVVEHYLEFVLNHGENIVTCRTEFRNLPEPDRERLVYLQTSYVAEWSRALRRLRPELSDDESWAMCQAAIGLLQSPTDYEPSLPPDRLARLLTNMAIEALTGAPSESQAPPAPAAEEEESAADRPVPVGQVGAASGI